MPGCSLRNDILVTVPAFGSGNAATMFLPVPNNPWLLALEFFNQAFVPDPAANGAGLTVSNGVRARIGRY